MTGGVGPCNACGSGKMVPVLDKNIEHSPKPGNKYRTACLSCSRFGGMTSKEAFKGHARPHILPQGEDSSAENIIPLDQYDYGPELQELAERVGATPTEAATDGGDEQDDQDLDDLDDQGDAGDGDAPTEDESEDRETIAFTCTCGEQVEMDATDRLDECPHGCGEAYIWNTKDEK